MSQPLARNVWKQYYKVVQSPSLRQVYERATGELMGYCEPLHPGETKDKQGWRVYRNGILICERRVVQEAVYAITEATVEF